jgi:hypothetical protein
MWVVTEPAIPIEKKRVAVAVHSRCEKAHILYFDIGYDVRDAAVDKDKELPMPVA